MKKAAKGSSIRLSLVLGELLPVIRPYLGRFAIGLSLISLSTAAEVITPMVIGYGVDAAIGSKKDWLLQLGVFYLGLILLKAVLETGQAYLIQSTGQAVTHDLRSLLFHHMARLPVAYFDKNPTGKLLTRVINDIKALSELFTASFSVLLLDVMIIFGTVVAMLWVHWSLASLVLLTFPVVIFVIRYFGKQVAVAYRNVRIRLAEINGFLGENIGAIATIQRLSAENERLCKFESIVKSHQDAQMDSLRIFALVQPYANILNGVAMATLLGVGGIWVVQGKLTVGILVAFLGYIRNLFQPIRDLVEKYNTFLSAMVSAERVVNILKENREEPAPPRRGPAREGPEQWTHEVWRRPSKTFGDILPIATWAPFSRAGSPATDVMFDSVSFRYPSGAKPAVSGVSFTVDHGASVAIVGATGSGKSTLIRLLLRFYEPDEGNILFGGKRLTEWALSDLRRQIGVIHQEIYLFQGTLRENLKLGRDEFSDAYLMEHCRRSQLWPFVESRGGLDMEVFEGGSNLSIGEKQLVSFARVLIFDPPVMVLDEATASIDRRLEQKLIDAIHEVIVGRTSIIIAHRLSTIRQCRKIIVMHSAKVVEEGTRSELLDRKGHFRRFHDIHVNG